MSVVMEDRNMNLKGSQGRDCRSWRLGRRRENGTCGSDLRSRSQESGQIIFRGKEVHPKSPREAIDLGIALVPEDRKRHGAMLGISIKNNINMPIYERNSKLSVINSKQEMEIAKKVSGEYGN